MRKKTEAEPFDVPEIRMDQVTISVLGLSPLIMHRQSQKVAHELLFPRIKSRGDKQTSLKHNPLEEFRDCLYVTRDDAAPTLVHFPSRGFSRGMASVAMDMPGAGAKAQMQRLTSIDGINTQIWGLPKVSLMHVRQSGINRAPDIRSRPIFPMWACQITVVYYALVLNAQKIVRLVQAAGLLRGLGDDRPEKGGPFGKYCVVNHDDKAFLNIVENQGREAQLEAVNNPQFYDSESEELVTWFEQELEVRAPTEEQKRVAAMPRRRKRNGDAEAVL